MSDETEAPAPDASAVETPEQLLAEPGFKDTLINGIKGSPAQRTAEARWNAAHEGVPAVLPQREPASMGERAVAAMSETPEDATEYRFTWHNAADLQFDELSEMDALARETAASIGAPVQMAQDFADVLQRGVAETGGTVSYDEAELRFALDNKYGERADSVLAQARSVVAKMPPDAQEWVLGTLDCLPTGKAVWAINQLANMARD